MTPQGSWTSGARWEPAPVGVILVPGLCPARDSDGQGCARGALHPFGLHQSTGLRAYLEGCEERALLRIYEAGRADALEAMEAPLLARFEYVPVAHQDYVQTKEAGLHPLGVMVVGIWAPTEHVTFAIRAVCYARPW